MWIDVYDTGNNKIGFGPIRNVEFFEATAMLNGVGTYRFGGIPTDEHTMDLLMDDSGQRIALGWEIVDGAQTYVGGGPIHQRIVTGEEGGWKLEISGPDLLGLLTYDTIGALSLSGSGATSLTTLLGLVSAQGWTTSLEAGTPNFVAKFSNETLINALIAVANKIGGYFYHDHAGTSIHRLKWIYTFASSGVVASGNANPLAVERNPNLCLITSIKETQDSWDIINTVVVYGAGIGETRFNMSSATIWPDGTSLSGSYVLHGQTYTFNRATNTITNATSIAAYGTRKMELPFKLVRPLKNLDPDVIEAANFLVLAAVTWLSTHSRAEKFYEIGIAGLRQFLLPGCTILAQVHKWVNGRKPIDIDTDLIVMATTHRWDDSGHYTTGMQVASVGRYAATGDDVAIEMMGQSIVMEAHPQTGPAIDTITYREHLDDSANAHLYFFLGNEVLTVNQVIVRMRADALRSTVKTVAGDADVSVSLDLTASVDLPPHQHPVPDHQHVTDVSQDTTPDSVLGVNFFTIGGDNVVSLKHAGGFTVYHLYTTPGGGTVTDTDDGGEATVSITGTADGIVDLSHAIHPEYGIYDDPNPHYLATDLDYQVNGSGFVQITSGNVISGAVGWYLLDITTHVAAALSGRPLATVFDVEFRVHPAGTGKKAQITAQIERRMSIQAIAVY